MRILRRQISTFVVSIVLSLLGVAALLFTFWRILPHISSVKDLLSTFMALLWTEKFDLIPNFEFELIYIVVLGDVLLISGVILYVLSVQWFLLPGKVVWYQCPFCHKDWRSTGDKALIHCPHCRQLVHPTPIEKKEK
jgi:DNA-directed RNA polymerase subunit RPC12/RpoP